MNLSATQKPICNINVKKLLVAIVLLSFLVVSGCKKKLKRREIKKASGTKTINPKQTSIERQNYTPRVVVVVVQTHATEGWCRLMLSAIMNKIEIVTIALGALYSHEKRPGWFMEYIENEMLKDEDIIISVDGSDTIVTERENFEKGVQYFADKSAPNESSFTSDGVARGIQISPMIFLADPHCYAPQLDVIIDSAHKEHEARCHWFYKYAYGFAEKHSLMNLIKNADDEHNFLSAGAFISRVWAFKKAHAAYKSVLAMSRKWWCDQSIWVLVFIWSVTQTNINRDLRALPAGLISLDYGSKFFHYPLSTLNTSAPILHFTGDPIAWKSATSYIFPRLKWFKWFEEDSKNRCFTGKSINKNYGSRLKMHSFNGIKVYVNFTSVCKKVLECGESGLKVSGK